jgi:hypothetical protein
VLHVAFARRRVSSWPIDALFNELPSLRTCWLKLNEINLLNLEVDYQ